MGFRCGIVGLPNVGKSTLFNALTKAGIDAENFPFCTIEPNTGVVPVPDPRLHEIAAIVEPARVIPSTVEFIDIAGLVEGASRGEGLGNKFLGHVRETQAIAHVVRCFTDDNIVHVAGDVSPTADIDIINTELALADLDTLEKVYDRSRRTANAGDQESRALIEVLDRVRDGLGAGKPVRALGLEDIDLSRIRECHFLTEKPVMYVANIAEDGFENNPMLEEVERVAASESAVVIPVCNKIEAEIAELDAEESLEFIRDLGLEEPGLNRFIRAGYDLLGLMNFFTAGPKEARAWTCRRGTHAPQAAGVIHTDFEKGFIRAEVVSYEDFMRHGGEAGAKEAGRWRLEGKDYIVENGDIVHFRFNV